MPISNTDSTFPQALWWLRRPPTTTRGVSLGDAELRLLEALEQGDPVDVFQLASTARLAPTQAEDALQRLLALGLIREHVTPERLSFVLDRAALKALLEP
jgi:hypothetical protein